MGRMCLMRTGEPTAIYTAFFFLNCYSRPTPPSSNHDVCEGHPAAAESQLAVWPCYLLWEARARQLNLHWLESNHVNQKGLLVCLTTPEKVRCFKLDRVIVEIVYAWYVCRLFYTWSAFHPQQSTRTHAWVRVFQESITCVILHIIFRNVAIFTRT